MTVPALAWLAVGRIRRPHGLHGEVVAEVVTDFPERLSPGVEVRVGLQDPERSYRVHTVRWHKGAWLLAFEGLLDLDAVEFLRDHWLFLPAQEREALPPTYYYEHELVGSRCRDRGGRDLGEVTALVFGGGQTLLVVHTPDGGEVLVPFVSPIVVGVNADARVIELDPPAGLCDGDAL